MIRYKVLQLLFLASSMTSQMIGMEPTQELRDHLGKILSTMPDADDSTVITSSADGATIRIWNMNKRQLLKTLYLGSAVQSVALHTNEASVLTGSLDKKSY